ncbi:MULTISPECIES: FAD-dependent oxidoreductase [unclassified Streptomyces]|uniref:FAD-dependent oxidoreductase n=1 Tax=unclassified Streptomyces TaxID=2593676 RepID=UPI000CD5ADA6|nr:MULTISPECIES: FAD-dependent oxidoreductase [unclassified Streptomyces]
MTGLGLDLDLLIVGGGPAGCAAALTAAGVGMRSLLIENDARLCGKLHHIPALNNVLGGFRAGPDLATVITADIAGTPLCRTLTGTRVAAVAADDSTATVTLEGGEQHTAPHVVLATGVEPLRPDDADWITSPDALRPPPHWEARPAVSAGQTWLVIGADRPLGTFLRAHLDLDIKLLVPYPPGDAYKTEEVTDDPRVVLLPVRHVTLHNAVTAELLTPVGERRRYRADAAFTNIGSAPVPPAGLVRDASGYCPPGLQHPRLITAGDLRSGTYQRIMTATGSGAEAALRPYYAARG